MKFLYKNVQASFCYLNKFWPHLTLSGIFINLGLERHRVLHIVHIIINQMMGPIHCGNRTVKLIRREYVLFIVQRSIAGKNQVVGCIFGNALKQ